MLIRSPSLLITDDDAAFRQTLCGLFRQRGFRTLAASDGQEALEIVSREPVHLLLLDVHMPRLTGLETLQLVKQINDLLPIILLTAQLDEAILEQARQANAFSILRKPVALRVLTDVVAQAMRTAYNWEWRYG
jgi:CheY-like chemotaxis protein